MLPPEGIKIEYKREIPEDSSRYLKAIAAFANSDGGEICFGIDDDRTVVGMDEGSIPLLMDKIANGIYNAIEPKIIPEISVQRIEGKSVIVVSISQGQQPPYFLKSKGIMDGTYIRAAGTTRLAAGYQIQELILSSRNMGFDRLKLDRELSEEEIEAFCDHLENHAEALRGENVGRRLSLPNLLSFSLITEENGRYFATNGYQLIEGKAGAYPNAMIQCALFKGTEAGIFLDRKDISGAIDEQVEMAITFILRHISLWSRTDGIARKDFYELPIGSIREAVTNAVCHRSYLSEGRIQIAIYDDRITITSPGGLPRGLTIEMLKEGRSMIHNTAIAKAFWYMGLIEEWGLGVPRIIKEAKEYGLKEPLFEDLDGRFRVTLYRRKPAFDDQGIIIPVLREEEPPYQCHSLDGKLISLLQENPYTTQKELAASTRLSLITIKRAMQRLQEQGSIRRQGNNRKGRWIIVE